MRNGCIKVVGMCVFLYERGMIYVFYILKLIIYLRYIYNSICFLKIKLEI